MRAIALALLATVVVGGAAINRAEAGVAAPLAANTIADNLITNVAWVCNADRCDWHPWLPATTHPVARRWEAPRNPWCYWEKRRGHWRQVCP